MPIEPPSEVPIGTEFAAACRTPLLRNIRISYAPVNGQEFTRTAATTTYPTSGEDMEMEAWYELVDDDQPDNQMPRAWVSVGGVSMPLNSPWETYSEVVGDISDYAKEQVYERLGDLVSINSQATQVLANQIVAALRGPLSEMNRLKADGDKEGLRRWLADPANQALAIAAAERERVFKLLNYLAVTFNDRGPIEERTNDEGESSH